MCHMIRPDTWSYMTWDEELALACWHCAALQSPDMRVEHNTAALHKWREPPGKGNEAAHVLVAQPELETEAAQSFRSLDDMPCEIWAVQSLPLAQVCHSQSTLQWTCRHPAECTSAAIRPKRPAWGLATVTVLTVSFTVRRPCMPAPESHVGEGKCSHLSNSSCTGQLDPCWSWLCLNHPQKFATERVLRLMTGGAPSAGSSCQAATQHLQ